MLLSFFNKIKLLLLQIELIIYTKATYYFTNYCLLIIIELI